MQTVSPDHVFDNLSDVLPPTILQTLRALLSTPPIPTLLTHLHALTTTTLLPLLTALTTQLTTLLSNSPTLVAAVSTLALAILLYRLLRLAQRILLFWTRLLFRLFFYAAAGLVASAVWQRGVEKTAQDVVLVAGRVTGWVMMVVGVWVREYEKAQREAQGQQAGRAGAYQQQGRQGGGGYYQAQQGGRGRDGWR